MESPARRFAFKLARTLGKTVAWIDRHMSAAEFAEWWEIQKIEPFGDDWLQASTIAVSNLAPWGGRRLANDHFVPKVKKPKTAEELERVMQHFARVHNKIARNARGDNRKSGGDDQRQRSARQPGV